MPEFNQEYPVHPSDNVVETKMTVKIPKELHDRLFRAIPWGLRRHLISSVLETVVTAIEKEGEIVMGAVMAGSYRLVWDEPSGTARNSSGDSGNG